MSIDSATLSAQRIAGFGATMQADWSMGPFDDAHFSAAFDRWVEQRVCGLAASAASAQQLVLSDEQSSMLHSAAQHATMTALRLEALAIDCTRMLRTESIRALVMKGPAAARLDYPRPEWREFGDIDLFVHSCDFDQAAAVFERSGCERRFREPRSGFTSRFGKGVCFETPSGLEIDLHRSFVAGPFADIAHHDRVWLNPESFFVGGVSVETLSRELRAIGAALHAVLGRQLPRLVPLRDVIEISERCDAQHLVETADELGVSAVLARAVLVAHSQLGILPSNALFEWAFSMRSSERDRAKIRAYTHASRSYAGQVRAGFRSVPGLRNKTAYAFSLAVPDRAYLLERDRSYSRRLVRLVRRRSS